MDEGHINDTYKIVCNEATFVLQKKNAAVFTNMAALLFNLSSFIEYSDDSMYSDLFIKSIDNKLFVLDANSDHWVLMNFMDGRKASMNHNLDLQLLGAGVGTFLDQGSKMDFIEFQETIPQFHDIEYRLKQFDAALMSCHFERKQLSQSLLQKINAERKELLDYKAFLETNCQKQICHNDTKSDNIIVIKGEAILLDLDTIMPGYIAYDFGDALRSLFGIGPEDRLVIRKESEILNIYSHFRKGFLSKINTSINKSDLSSLDYATIYMCYIMGIRFLTDYLNGDIYYKTEYEEQNFKRAEGQLKMGSILKKIL